MNVPDPDPDPDPDNYETAQQQLTIQKQNADCCDFRRRTLAETSTSH